MTKLNIERKRGGLNAYAMLRFIIGGQQLRFNQQ